MRKIYLVEQKQYAATTINLRLAAVRRVAFEAADAGLLIPELAAGIRRVKGVRRVGVRVGNWLSFDRYFAMKCLIPPSSQTATAETSMHGNVQWRRIPASAKLRAGPILGMAHQCIPADIRRKSKWRANELCQPTPAPPRAWPESSRCPSCFGA